MQTVSIEQKYKPKEVSKVYNPLYPLVNKVVNLWLSIITEMYSSLLENIGNDIAK